MATQTVKMQIQLRRDTAEHWEKYKHIVPASGEPCFVVDENILKIGDGIHTFAELEPINRVKLDIAVDDKSIVLEDNVLKLMGFDEAEVGAQPVKRADGVIEWIIPSTDALDALKLDVDALKESIDEKIAVAIENSDHMSKTEAEDTLLSKVDAALTYAPKDEVRVTLERVKYEITNAPIGTLVNYGEHEIRVMCPYDTEWNKQNVGSNELENMYYIAFRAYAPDGAVSFKEDTQTTIEDQTMWYFENNSYAGVDEYGRKYSVVWLSVAEYNEGSGEWVYYGSESTATNYVGRDYSVEWYDMNGVRIAADYIRINYTNESCHLVTEPYYVREATKNANEYTDAQIEAKMADIVDAYEITEF